MSEKNTRCFVIMPFSETDTYEEDHFTKIYEQIFKPAIEKAGYEPYRVDEDKICDPIIGKIFDAVQNCPMSLCDLSSKNPNVLYELGLRQAYDKPVVLVKDEKTEHIFDVAGINTVSYNSNRLVENVEKAIKDIADALRQTKEGKEATLVKIVKAKSADFSEVNTSEQENIGILLKSIMSDIQELKSDRLMNYNGVNYNVNSYKVMGEEGPVNRTFEIRLKDGVTNKQIDNTMDYIMTLTRAHIAWSRNKNWLTVTAYQILGIELEWIKKELKLQLSS